MQSRQTSSRLSTPSKLTIQLFFPVWALPRISLNSLTCCFPAARALSHLVPGCQNKQTNKQTNEKRQPISRIAIGIGVATAHSQSTSVLPWRDGAPESRCVAWWGRGRRRTSRACWTRIPPRPAPRSLRRNPVPPPHHRNPDKWDVLSS